MVNIIQNCFIKYFRCCQVSEYFNENQNLEKGPSFAKRKEWRFILNRICEFLRLVDYLIQELLHRIVKTSVKRLHEYVSKSTSSNLGNKTNTDRYLNKILIFF